MAPIDVLRKEVKQYINIADEKSLRMVKAILEIGQEEEEEENWDDLPEELQIMIDGAIKQADEGGGVPHQKIVAKYYSQWFKK